MRLPSRSGSGLKSTSAPRTNEPLELFRGTFITGVYFSSDYCLWAFDFSSVPAGVEPFTDVWIITPDGERVLYIDPEEASDVVVRNHEFDRVVGGQVTREQPTDATARVRVEGDDGTSLEFELSFEQTVGTRLLNATSALTPKTVARTQFGTALSNVFLNRLVEANGTKVAGRFETGVPYRFEAERLSVITDATATLDGTNLGIPVQPDQPIEFGDVKNMPLYMHARAYLPIQDPASTTEQ